MNSSAGVGGPAVSLYALNAGWTAKEFVPNAQFYGVLVNIFSAAARGLPQLDTPAWLLAGPGSSAELWSGRRWQAGSPRRAPAFRRSGRSPAPGRRVAEYGGQYRGHVDDRQQSRCPPWVVNGPHPGPDGRHLMMAINFPSAPGGWSVPGMPRLPRLSLELTKERDGVFDGAWWPRSTDARTELPDLITALGAHLDGRIVRIGLDPSAWQHVPLVVDANGISVRVSWCAATAGTIALIRDLQDHVLLLVVPPDTPPAVAMAAMAGAAVTGNHTPAAELLG